MLFHVLTSSQDQPYGVLSRYEEKNKIMMNFNIFQPPQKAVNVLNKGIGRDPIKMI